MASRVPRHAPGNAVPLSRRKVATGMAAIPVAALGFSALAARSTAQTNQKEHQTMRANAFVYTELQASLPFNNVPWQKLNAAIAAQPGFIDKTWLSGLGNNSVGGLYGFASVEDSLLYCTDFFPALARDFGVAQTTRVFDNQATAEASAAMDAPHFGGHVTSEPGAFVYTEVQVSVPFEKAPWRDRNPVLRTQKGLLSKVWLSGHNTHTLGGLDAFDTVENALDFAINAFPKTTAAMNAAFYTRVFDARVTEDASRDLNSPYYL
ncbi:putative monooxygenase ydhR [Litoreibacter meonggei]|uniref:Putative monooxygenase ydhR n=1 Tax=Litoreibacter meonggei TaxID=1049199 RepID=A0A497VBR6_9RHOB|nr:YdhR family protein [Litoreibacter meonggei]RLJ41021.1 putative monooxygenase ydhR [Litoreibacter meonggei]